MEFLRCLAKIKTFNLYSDDYHGQYFAINVIERLSASLYEHPEDTVAGPIRRKEAVEDNWQDARLPLSSLRQYAMLLAMNITVM